MITKTSMKKCAFTTTVMIACAITNPEARSAAFVNLDFESAVQPLTLGDIPTTNAFPGWRVYAGDRELNEVPYNAVALSLADVSLLSFDSRIAPPPIEGSFMAFLYSGLVLTTNALRGPASLVQSGLVPVDSRSLQFKGYSDLMQVSLGGDLLDFFPLSSGTNYILYGADITPFAGQELELRFTAPLDPNREFPHRTFSYLDSIEFSSQVIPEPSMWALLVCGGGALLVVYRWRGKRS